MFARPFYAMCPMAELQRLGAKAGISRFHPLAIIRLMQGLFTEGSWGMTANFNVTGWPLVGLWIFESGLVVSMSVAAAVSQIADHPFREACQQWVSGHTPHLYVGDGSESIPSRAETGHCSPRQRSRKAPRARASGDPNASRELY